MNALTVAVTLVKPGPAIPVFEVGAYQYTGSRLPYAGDIITIKKAPDSNTDGPEERVAYVTRVDPTSEIPIRVTEAHGLTATPADDFILKT